MVRAVMVLAGCAMTLASGPPGAPWGMPSGRAGALRPPGALPLRSPAAFAGILCASRLRGGGLPVIASDGVHRVDQLNAFANSERTGRLHAFIQG